MKWTGIRETLKRNNSIFNWQRTRVRSEPGDLRHFTGFGVRSENQKDGRANVVKAMVSSVHRGMSFTFQDVTSVKRIVFGLD